MGSNHRLVLFTHALCPLNYPAVKTHLRVEGRPVCRPFVRSLTEPTPINMRVNVWFHWPGRLLMQTAVSVPLNASCASAGEAISIAARMRIMIRPSDARSTRATKSGPPKMRSGARAVTDSTVHRVHSQGRCDRLGFEPNRCRTMRARRRRAGDGADAHAPPDKR